MSKVHSLLLTIVIFISLSGCSYLRFPGVHKIDIQQGNIVTQDMIDQLKPGMTRRQVRFVMGTPLVTDTFNPDRWDYYYSKRKADGSFSKEKVSVFFKDDRLSHFSGDYRPTQEKNLTAQQ